ncbi:MAG: amino acid synthesis family protein [Candidatus Kaistia colombiensis]|nr:MAG: amino acid synthesis family protein [Kaistia sp.]
MTVIRKIVTTLEETLIEGDVVLPHPFRKASAVAVVSNSGSGRYIEDLSELMDLGELLGDILPRRAVALLGIPGDQVESFGKAVIVGAEGEFEHAAAIMHPKLGAPFRAVLGKGDALIPSAKKRAQIGAIIDVPLGHKDHARVRSHFDAMEVRIPDAPKKHEMVVAIAVTDSGRPLARVGGMRKEDIGQ